MGRSQFFSDVQNDLERAEQQYPPFNSPHEAYAIMLEEVDEVWALVKQQQAQHNFAQMRQELVQVAAMAARFALDTCEQQEKEEV